MKPPLPTHDDPGLQPERTSLAWARTVLATSVCSLTLIRFMDVLGSGAFLAILLLVSTAVAILVTQRRRYAIRVRGLTEATLTPNTAGVICIAGLVVCIGATIIALLIRSIL